MARHPKKKKICHNFVCPETPPVQEKCVRCWTALFYGPELVFSLVSFRCYCATLYVKVQAGNTCCIYRLKGDDTQVRSIPQGVINCTVIPTKLCHLRIGSRFMSSTVCSTCLPHPLCLLSSTRTICKVPLKCKSIPKMHKV